MKSFLVVSTIGLIICLSSLPALATVNLAQFVDIDPELALGSNPLSGVPDYYWYHGCSPTSGGMLIGYWDSHPSGNWSDLVEGDISSWNNTARNMVASPEHINDYWGTPDPDPGGHNDNCIADFMHTSRSDEGLPDGATWRSMVAVGVKDYTLWDDPTTPTLESYFVDCWRDEISLFSGPFTWQAFKNEIDAGKPMLLGLTEWHGGTDWYGHSVVGYGYQDDLFNIQIYNGTDWQNISTGGFAIWDTWGTSSSQSSWLGWNDETVYSYTDANGVEWWPFLDLTQANGYSYDGNYWDWAVMEGIYYHPSSHIPEPSSFLLLLSGLSGIFFLRRKKERS